MKTSSRRSVNTLAAHRKEILDEMALTVGTLERPLNGRALLDISSLRWQEKLRMSFAKAGRGAISAATGSSDIATCAKGHINAAAVTHCPIWVARRCRGRRSLATSTGDDRAGGPAATSLPEFAGRATGRGVARNRGGADHDIRRERTDGHSAQNLPKLGIPSCHLSLYEDPQAVSVSTASTRVVQAGLAYDEKGALTGARRQKFRSRELVPEWLWPQRGNAAL